MIVLITGASHTGKTLLAQKMLERYGFPYLSVDHLKMGLIRSGNTGLTPEDDDALTEYLWPIVREIIRTANENGQGLIVEGCYVPFGWRKDLGEPYASSVRFVCLTMTDGYIEKHFGEIVGHENDIEKREGPTGCTVSGLQKDNRRIAEGFRKAGERVVRIRSDYGRAIRAVLEQGPRPEE